MDVFFKNKKILLLILALCLVVSTAFLFSARLCAERGNRSVTAVMTMEDVEALSENGGQSTDEWLAALKDMGFGSILVTSAEEMDAVVSAGLSPMLLGGDPSLLTDACSAYVPYETSPDAETALSELEAQGIPLVLVENRYQTGAELPEGYAESIAESGVSMAKCFWLNHTFRARYATLGYTGAEEIENIFYRAATDRSIRILWAAPFMNGDEMVTDMDEYRAVFSQLSSRIAVQSLTLGSEFSTLTLFTQPRAAVAVLGFFVLALGVFLIWTLYPIGTKVSYALMLLALVCAVGLTWYSAELAVKLFAMAAAIVFPCCAVFETGVTLGRLEDYSLSRPRLLGSCALTLVEAVCISLLGGIVIASLMGSGEYLLELKLFTGVKLSQLVPVAYAVIVLFKLLYHEKGRSVFGDIKAALRSFMKNGKAKIIAVVILLALAVVVFILRTGDGMLSVPVFEQRVRNWLENALYARPRTKEFLIAFPCVCLSVLCAARHWKNALLPLGVLFSIGLASVCNTFCHARAEISLSLVRTLLSLGIGLVLGLIAVLIVDAVGKKLRGGGKNG